MCTFFSPIQFVLHVCTWYPAEFRSQFALRYEIDQFNSHRWIHLFYVREQPSGNAELSNTSDWKRRSGIDLQTDTAQRWMPFGVNSVFMLRSLQFPSARWLNESRKVIESAVMTAATVLPRFVPICQSQSVLKRPQWQRWRLQRLRFIWTVS
jgi:hypothetical protein